MHIKCDVVLYLISVLAIVIADGNESDTKELRKFPEGFIFGASSAAYQVEGAWNASDKSESIWDFRSHYQHPEEESGDVADDSYYLYDRDIEMVRELGVDFYRFSIAWTRILPHGFTDYLSQDGVSYYNNIINQLLKYKITPIITIYHWDLPQRLQELGGWANPFVIDWYADYATVLFSLFGDRVKYWITINEPRQICMNGYGDDIYAPGLKMTGIADYLCMHNVILAHAMAWRIYDTQYKPIQRGKVGISADLTWYEPASTLDSDIQAAEDCCQFMFGIFTHPIYSAKGDYPHQVKMYITLKSAEQGFARSRLPEFTQDQVDFIKGTYDFLGINHYFTGVVYRNSSVNNAYAVPSFEDDLGIMSFNPDNWTKPGTNEIYENSLGLQSILQFVKERYNNPPVIITENGCMSEPGLIDDGRVSHYRKNLNAVLDAIYDDGCNVVGYGAWSLMDNDEWGTYERRYGLYEVDYDSPEKTRTARKSALVFKEILRSRVIDETYTPESLNISITTK